jgi:hypothetical protein
MRKPLVLLAATALSAGLAAAPADAAAVRNCVATGTLAFSPPLTATRQTGTMTWTYSASCVGADTGGSSGLSTTAGTITFGYDGSCVTAQVARAGGEAGLLVGGVAMTTYDLVAPGRTVVREWVLVPNGLNPCNQSGALAVQTGPDLYTP